MSNVNNIGRPFIVKHQLVYRCSVIPSKQNKIKSIETKLHVKTLKCNQLKDLNIGTNTSDAISFGLNNLYWKNRCL